MGILDRLFEDRREDEFDYTTVSKSGKETDDPEKITKVIAILKSSKAGATTRLAKEFEEILQKQKEIDEALDAIKAKGMEMMNDLFSAKDVLYTRVLETSKVTLTMSKETIRKDVKFDTEKFILKILAIVPDLSEKVEEFKKECTSIKESVVKSTIKPALKEEGFSDFIKKIKNYITKIWDNINLWSKSYDKKLNNIKKQFNIDTSALESFKAYIERLL